MFSRFELLQGGYLLLSSGAQHIESVVRFRSRSRVARFARSDSNRSIALATAVDGSRSSPRRRANSTMNLRRIVAPAWRAHCTARPDVDIVARLENAAAWQISNLDDHQHARRRRAFPAFLDRLGSSAGGGGAEGSVTAIL